MKTEGGIGEKNDKKAEGSFFETDEPPAVFDPADLFCGKIDIKHVEYFRIGRVSKQVFLKRSIDEDSRLLILCLKNKKPPAWMEETPEDVSFRSCRRLKNAVRLNAFRCRAARSGS